jgi:hypothetical protein
MKKLMLAAFALSLAPSLALAAPTLKGQIAKDVRGLSAAKGLNFNARSIRTEAMNGANGVFSFTASKGGRIGLPATIYNVNGAWNATGKSLKVTDVVIKPAPFQPREGG